MNRSAAQLGGAMATAIRAASTVGVALIVTLSTTVRSVPKPSQWLKEPVAVS